VKSSALSSSIITCHGVGHCHGSCRYSLASLGKDGYHVSSLSDHLRTDILGDCVWSDAGVGYKKFILQAP
jgi:hypothetical protein